MTHSLLATKFFVPPLQANLVHRQRLLDRLDESLRDKKRLILISTPAGYGKTTLLSAWIQKSNYPVAWLSLDDADNDPVKFMTYLIFGLREIKPGIGAALEDFSSSQTQISNTQLTSLVNDLIQLPENTLIILDDYHNITRRTIHDAISYLLEHSAPNFHFIIATRADPPLPISRMRGRGQVVELRQNDLRFSLDELSDFFTRQRSLQLSHNDITALYDRTEGWAAGMQMAAASMVNQDDITLFIQDFTGSNRFILDYLLEEVLDNLAENIKLFLLRTSILDQLCAPLCDHLLADFSDQPVNSQAILEELEHKNLFIIPLDDRREWYRFHRLFSDLLRQRLELFSPDSKPVLHQRASNWYELNGFPESAIDHAILAQDYPHAAELIEASAEAVLMQSQVTTLLSWLHKLPISELHDRPVLSVYYAWVLLWSGAPLETIDEHMKVSASRQGHSIFRLPLQAFLEIYNGNVDHAITLSQQALNQLPAEEELLRSLANFVLASCYLARGESAKGIEQLEKTARASQRVGNVMIAALVLCELGDESQKLGQLYQAQRLYNQALEISSDQQGNLLPVAGKALIGLGDLEREWNNLISADQITTRGIALAEQWSVLGSFEGYINLAMIKDALGETQTGDTIFDHLHQLAYQFDASEVDDYVVEMVAARRNIVRGDFAAVEGWIEKRSLEAELPPDKDDSVDKLLQSRLRKYENTIRARYLIAKEQYDQALKLLDQVYLEAESMNRIYLQIDIEILRAISYYKIGDVSSAVEAFYRALNLSEPEGFKRIFLDHGKTLIGLINTVQDEIHEPRMAAYTEMLLDSLTAEFQAKQSSPGTKSSEILEPLSHREMEVLQLLQSSLSSTEMAHELSISINTLRTHQKNIYAKLNAHSRYEAIARAKEAGLL